MGYTHYWRHKDINAETFDKIVEDLKKTIPSMGVKLCDGAGEGTPLLSSDLIYLNGDASVGKDHETFLFERLPERGFNFCKTAYKPYDIAVTTCLVIAKHYLGDGIGVSSDGRLAEWKPAMDLCQKILGYGDDFKLGD